jgi:hypothetical protein
VPRFTWDVVGMIPALSIQNREEKAAERNEASTSSGAGAIEWIK